MALATARDLSNGSPAPLLHSTLKQLLGGPTPADDAAALAAWWADEVRARGGGAGGGRGEEAAAGGCYLCAGAGVGRAFERWHRAQLHSYRRRAGSQSTRRPPPSPQLALADAATPAAPAPAGRKAAPAPPAAPEARRLRPRGAGAGAAAGGRAALRAPVVIVSEGERCDMPALQQLIKELSEVGVGQGC